MKRWEYLFEALEDSGEDDLVFSDSEDRFAELGNAGWELVAVARNNRTRHQAVFKRRKE